MSLMIPNDLFGVVRGTGRLHRVIIFFVEIGDRDEPISGEGICIGMGRKGRKGSCKGCICCSLG